MFEKIVLAVDGSDQAKGAVAAAADLAAKSGGDIRVVHVHEKGYVSRETIDLETLAEAKVLMQAVLDVLAKADVKATGELRAAASTAVAKEILEAARGFNADCIVLGSRGLGDFSGLLLGSVAHKVIQLADCPVVVVRAAGVNAARLDHQQEQTTSVA